MYLLSAHLSKEKQMPNEKTLVERLEFHANESWPYAEMVSNMRRPESDNNFGRAAADMRLAAARIRELEAALRQIQHLIGNSGPSVNYLPYTIDQVILRLGLESETKGDSNG
jgi:hypothetical protein